MLVPMLPLFAAGCRLGRCGHAREMSKEDLAELLKDRSEHVLDEVDATEAQVRSVHGILDGVAADLTAMRKEHQDLRAQLIKALGADRVDRQELERLRRQALDLIDRASARGLGALADTSDVLTAEQRRDLVAQWRRHAH